MIHITRTETELPFSGLIGRRYRIDDGFGHRREISFGKWHQNYRHRDPADLAMEVEQHAASGPDPGRGPVSR